MSFKSWAKRGCFSPNPQLLSIYWGYICEVNTSPGGRCWDYSWPCLMLEKLGAHCLGGDPGPGVVPSSWFPSMKQLSLSRQPLLQLQRKAVPVWGLIWRKEM